MRSVRTGGWIGSAMLIGAAFAPTHAAAKPVDTPPRKADYGYAFWPNGFRKEKDDASANIFAVETGRYGFTLDTADFAQARLGPIEGPGYAAAAAAGAKPVLGLPRADFRIEIEHRGSVYRAVSCLAGRQRDPRQAILMESGRLAQHYHFPGLRFEDGNGKVLETDSLLRLVAWPSSLTLTLRAAPDSAYENGPCPGRVGTGRAFRASPVDVPHRPELDPPTFTLAMWVRIPRKVSPLDGHHWLVGKNRNEAQEGGFGLLLNRTNVSAVLNIGGGRKNLVRVDRPKALEPDAWCHLAMTYDGDSLRLYVDGRAAGAKRIGKARVPGKDPLRIGGRPDGQGKPVHAVFDELRIYDRALGAKEILAYVRAPGKAGRSGLAWEMHFDDAPAGKAATPDLSGATVRLALNDRMAETKVPGPWAFGDAREFVLHCPMADEPWRTSPPTFVATGHTGGSYQTAYVPATGAYVVDIPRFERDWKTGYTDIRKYDEVELTVVNGSASRQDIPVLFDVGNPANITGMTPILCDAGGRPTGIPVQLSKNWHHGTYARLYAILPAAPGRTRYRLRIAYGFWGLLPAASHAQLCLWGYGGNGRWDQLAIGCWGETMCFDTDNSLTPMMVTDVRLLMTRNGKDGRMWSWTDGGWGGDWIAIRRAGGDKLMPTGMKTAYLAHGPCLTDVRHHGHYGRDRDLAFDARVSTLRTDDYNRVFQTFRYRVDKPLDAARAHLFKMGPTGGLLTPRIACGNRDGLLAEHQVPGSLQAGSLFKKGIVLTGPGPWWVAFPGSYSTSDRDWGTGSRGLVIRSFQATLGGKTHRNPVISFPVHLVDTKSGLAGLNLELVAPEGVAQLAPGDTIELDVEWITVPRIADDYYGPNEAFRSHLAQNPRSWKTVHREAVGNDLEVRVTGGAVRRRYPVVVSVAGPEVQVAIRGGVGAVPIRFEGVRAPAGYALSRLQDGNHTPLDQAVNGRDFWQTDYDPASGTYAMTFNLLLDGVKESSWILAPE